MEAAERLDGVEIEFWVDWYDGPLTGVAIYDGAAYWFEAAADWDPTAETRPLNLFPLAPEELAKEREWNRLYKAEAEGKPVEEWPGALRDRDFSLPTKRGVREPIGWFLPQL